MKSNAKPRETIYTVTAGRGAGWQARKVATKAEQAELNRAESSAPSVPVTGVWRTIRGFIFWSYERGTVQYDIMVTLILLFVFLGPRLINFHDRPVERNPLPTGVVVYPDGRGGLLYQLDAKAVDTGSEVPVRDQLLRVIEPISGEVSISRYEPVTDRKGHITAYKVWLERQ